MSKSNQAYVVADHNYADTRWSPCIFKADDFRITGKSPTVRNIVPVTEFNRKEARVVDS